MVLRFIYHHKKFSEAKVHHYVTRIWFEKSRLWFHTDHGAYSLLLSKLSEIYISKEYAFDDEI